MYPPPPNPRHTDNPFLFLHPIPPLPFIPFLHPRVFLSCSHSCPCFKDSLVLVQSAAWEIRQTEGRTLIMFSLSTHSWIMCDCGDEEESVWAVSCRVQKLLNVDWRASGPLNQQFYLTRSPHLFLFLNTSLLMSTKLCLQNKVVGWQRR